MVPGNEFCNARTEQKLYPVYFEISGCVWFPLNYNCREHVMLADLITCRYTTKQSIKTELEAPYGQAICAWQIFLDMFYFCLCTAKMSIFPWQWSCSKTDHANFLTRFPGQVNAWWHICSAFSCDEQTDNFLPHARAMKHVMDNWWQYTGASWLGKETCRECITRLQIKGFITAHKRYDLDCFIENDIVSTIVNQIYKALKPTVKHHRPFR